MKTFKIFMAVAICAVAAMSNVEPSSAQDYTKKEKRELSREMKKQQDDFYKRPHRDVRKTARKWEKEGWKSMNLPIEKQLDRTWDREAIMDAEGYPKYVSVTVESTGASFVAAQMQAENVAKVRIASNICSSVAALADNALANNDTDPRLVGSVSKAVENSKIIVSQKLGRVFPSTTVYKKKGDEYTVRVIVLYDQRQALEIAHEVILQELKNESEQNRKQLEAMMGMDKLREQYNECCPIGFDEVL